MRWRLRVKKYDELKRDGIKNPSHLLRNMKGYFRCCVYKWGKVRQRDQWSLVCAAAPIMARKVKELPNTMRRMLGMKTKFSARRCQNEAGTTTIVPSVLENAVADIVVPCQTTSF